MCNFYLSVAESIHEIHSHVAGTLRNQQTTNKQISPDLLILLFVNCFSTCISMYGFVVHTEPVTAVGF